jgi:hypothetical protein
MFMVFPRSIAMKSPWIPALCLLVTFCISGCGGTPELPPTEGGQNSKSDEEIKKQMEESMKKSMGKYKGKIPGSG